MTTETLAVVGVAVGLSTALVAFVVARPERGLIVGRAPRGVRSRGPAPLGCGPHAYSKALRQSSPSGP